MDNKTEKPTNAKVVKVRIAVSNGDQLTKYKEIRNRIYERRNIFYSTVPMTNIMQLAGNK